MTDHTNHASTKYENVKQVRQLIADIITAGLTAGNVPVDKIPELIKTVSSALYNVGEAEKPEFVPAVTVRESLKDKNHIISMIDGSKHKIMGPHLKKHGLTADDYRARYGLPATYPMTAPNYSKHRSELARKAGLGRRTGQSR